MIKTLRITSIIMVVSAAVMLVFPVLFGVRGSKEIEQFLSAAGAIDKFKENANNQADNNENHTSPLVMQAQAFTSFLNPPKPVEPPPDSQSSGIRRPPTVVSKFKLIGTSYFAAHPELSIALIDEPGKGMHWVKQAAEVGYLIIEQIKDGLVVVKDGQKTFEMTAENRIKKNPLIKDSSAPDSSAAAPAPTPLLVADKPNPPAPVDGRQPPENRQKSKPVRHYSPNLGKVLMSKNPEDLENLSEDEKKLASKVLSQLETMKVTSEEAQKLDNLGKELKDAKKEDPNKYRRTQRTRRSRRTSPSQAPPSPSTSSAPSQTE